MHHPDPLSLGLRADWLAALKRRICQPPLRPRIALCSGTQVIGSVEPDFFDRIDAFSIMDRDSLLQKKEHSEDLVWSVQGELTVSLAYLADAMLASGLTGAWRNEQLVVEDETTRALGTIERAAVRPLGITTHAVHMVGFVSLDGPDSHIWVQQRALDKANDPGKLDTLMGGMVSAADALASALERETWEEAGLRLEALHNLSYGGRVSIRRPTQEARFDMGGAGYMVEHIDWFRCNLPAELVPQNQDGEVAGFSLLDINSALSKMENDAFTDEAALVLIAALKL